ncbi:TonB-dependent receptor plug domain-containing protein [Hoylesella nanceiensis]|uniref:TonB-dependent receptor plug domain-containing protein n=1 Tax=Hoylesella nanceiensis TaxID=425941 RepID=UPI001C5F3EB1|nr:TonB-dependent receptor [Hoylesella nanceiensis]MBW4767355.1 TonB-dependent receptor plug domain-containing protein [Hoylesella nanceiensis]
MLRKNLILFFLFLCALSIDAQNDSITTTYQLEGVKIYGSKQSINALSLQPIQSFDSQQMQQLGFHRISDAVKYFAGVAVKDYGGLGGLKTISLRGLSSHHTAVSYDGLVLSNLQAGQIDIGRFTTDGVTQTSVALGHSSALLQTARHYASAGILMIETDGKAFLYSNKYTSVNGSLTLGSFNYYQPAFRLWQKINPTTSIGANVTYIKSKGDYPFTLKNGSLTTKEKRQNDDISSLNSELNLFHLFKEGVLLQSKVNYYHSERGLPGGVILYNHDAKERLWDDNFAFQTTLQMPLLDQRMQMKAILNYSYARNKYIDLGSQYPTGMLKEINSQNEFYLSSAFAYTLSSALTLSLSQDFSLNKLLENAAITAQPVRFTSLTALNLKYHYKRFKGEGTLVSSFSSEKTRNNSSALTRFNLSPSIAMSYALLPNKGLLMRLMLKGCYRMPSFNELYYLKFGNTKLRPEQAMMVNCGLTYKGLLFNKGKIETTVDAYYNKVKDKLVAFPSLYVWKMVNFGKVNIYGLDLTTNVSWPLSKDFSLQGTLSYSLQQALDRSDRTTYSFNKQLPYTPKHSAHCTLVAQLPWLSVGYSMSTNSERYSMMQQTSEYRLAPFTEHSVTLSKDFMLKQAQMVCSLTLQNITNQQYDIIKYYPMPGRQVRFTASLTL